MENFYIILFVCYMAFAYNRKSVSLSMPKLIEDGLDTSHAGLILSCQNVAMSGSKLLFGMLSDRMNPLKLFASGLLLTGTTTLLFASSMSVVDFCTFWFLNGLAQGCGWPPLSKIIRQRADPKNFGTIWSFLSASNNVSGCLSPFLTTLIAVNFGWRYGLYSAGLTSVLLCWAPIFLLYSSPVKETKSSEIPEEKVKSDTDSSQTILTLLKDPFLWLVFTCFMVVFCARSTIVDWGLLFMKQERDIPLTRGSAFTSSFECGGFIGRLLAGYVSDIFVQRSQKNKAHQVPSYQIRMYVAIGFLLGAIFSIHLFRTSLNSETSLICIMATGFSCGAFLYGLIAIFGIAASESAPSHLSGSAYAIAAFGGNLGATLSGLPICYLASQFSWSTVLFLLESIIFVILTTVLYLRNLQSSVSNSNKND